MISLLITTSAFAKDFTEDNIFSGDDNKKVAILMVHFGTTHADTRELTLDVINEKVKKQFPSIEVREAYSSRIVIKRLHDKFNISKNTPLQALMQLYLDGYTHILIQSTTLIDGAEMLSIRKDAEKMQPFFTEIRIGNPLLYTVEDYESVIKALTRDNNPNIAYIWVGHGTSYASTSQYAMTGYILKQQNVKNCFVGTIEGYPTYDDVLQQLKKTSLKKVVLLPFMYVAGEHAKNDIAQEWKNLLEEEGYDVSVEMKGLGENPEIQSQIIDHLTFISKHRHLHIMTKKRLYRYTGEKLKDNNE